MPQQAIFQLKQRKSVRPNAVTRVLSQDEGPVMPPAEVEIEDALNDQAQVGNSPPSALSRPEAKRIP